MRRPTLVALSCVTVLLAAYLAGAFLLRPDQNTLSAGMTGSSPKANGSPSPKGVQPRIDGDKKNVQGVDNQSDSPPDAVQSISFDSGVYSRINRDVVWSPNSAQFVYVTEEPNGKIGVYLAQTGDQSKGIKVREFAYDVTYGNPFVRLCWSRDGAFIYYIFGSTFGPDYKPVFYMGKIETATHKVYPFRMPDIPVLPGTITWAPQAGLVSFWGGGGIQRVNLVSGQMTRLVRVESMDSLFRVAGSPDGTKLAYTRTFGFRESALQKVFVLNVLSGVETCVSNPGVYSWNPQWFCDGQKLGFLTTAYSNNGFPILLGDSGPLPFSEGIAVVEADGKPVRNFEFKGESIIGFSPVAGDAGRVEVYTGRQVKMTEQGGISFTLDTHRIMSLPDGKIVWEKKFPKVQSGENNGVQWIDKNTWVNTVFATNSETKTIILKDINDREIATVDGVIDKLFSADGHGLVFTRQSSSGQEVWFLGKDGRLRQLTSDQMPKQITGVNNGQVAYLEGTPDQKAQRLRMVRLQFQQEGGSPQ